MFCTSSHIELPLDAYYIEHSAIGNKIIIMRSLSIPLIKAVRSFSKQENNNHDNPINCLCSCCCRELLSTERHEWLMKFSNYYCGDEMYCCTELNSRVNDKNCYKLF